MSHFVEELPGRSSFIRLLRLKVAESGPGGVPVGKQEIHISMEGRVTYVYLTPADDVPGQGDQFWRKLKAAASKGRYYNRVIKRKFDYVRKY